MLKGTFGLVPLRRGASCRVGASSQLTFPMGWMVLKAFLGKPSKRALVEVSENDLINGCPPVKGQAYTDTVQ